MQGICNIKLAKGYALRYGLAQRKERNHAIRRKITDESGSRRAATKDNAHCRKLDEARRTALLRRWSFNTV